MRLRLEAGGAPPFCGGRVEEEIGRGVCGGERLAGDVAEQSRVRRQQRAQVAPGGTIADHDDTHRQRAHPRELVHSRGEGAQALLPAQPRDEQQNWSTGRPWQRVTPRLRTLGWAKGSRLDAPCPRSHARDAALSKQGGQRG